MTGNERVLETQRLILRPFCETDYPDVFDYLKEPLVHCFDCMRLKSLEEAKKECERKAKEKEFLFAIVLKENGKVIGEIEAHPETSQPDQMDEVQMDTFSPCWMLSPAYHKKGYAFEAAKAFFDYLFHEKGARRIYAYTEEDNIASQRVCEKLGMRREGLFVEFVSFVNDRDGNPIYENTYQYAILKKEWEALR